MSSKSPFEFRRLFAFNPRETLSLGVESECFIADENGKIVPEAEKVIKGLNNTNRFKPELSACQIEHVTGPHPITEFEAWQYTDLLQGLNHNDLQIRKILNELGLKRSEVTVGPVDMCCDIYPMERYKQIASEREEAVIRAACRVIGTHIHVGMPGPNTALRVYNCAIDHFDELCRFGGEANTERLRLYKVAAPNCQPIKLSSWQQLHNLALHYKYVNDPRQWWGLIRINVLGTIEFRMFPASADSGQVANWAIECLRICKRYL